MRNGVSQQRRTEPKASAFQVHHRTLLVLLEDAKKNLPEREWHSLRTLLLMRLHAEDE